MRAGKIIMIIAGGLLILFSLGLALVSTGAVALNNQQQKNGFFTAPREIYQVDSYAITAPDIEVGVGVREEDAVGTLLVRGESAGPELFIGVGPQDDVARYLADVAHSELRNVQFSPFDVSYREIEGTDEPLPPASQDFWQAQASGSGLQELDWNLESGDWTLVVMNANGTAPVAAELQVGFRSDLLGTATAGLWIATIFLLCAGVALLVGGIVLLRRTPRYPAYPGGPGGPAGYGPAGYGPAGYGPPGYGAPGYGPPGYGAPAGPYSGGPYAGGPVPGPDPYGPQSGGGPGPYGGGQEPDRTPPEPGTESKRPPQPPL